MARQFLLYYSISLFFANGGGKCYIVSVGTYAGSGGQVVATDLIRGIDELRKAAAVTLLLIPDGSALPKAELCYSVYRQAIHQCAELKNRFTIIDLWISNDPAVNNAGLLREFDFGEQSSLGYVAVYYPRVFTSLDYYYTDEVSIKITGLNRVSNLAQLKTLNNTRYTIAKKAIKDMDVLLPCSGAIAGQYVEMDKTRGVWKAPVNVNLKLCIKPEKMISENEHKDLNLDTATGRSINVIRSFPGRGTAIIWGARTMAGNDNEWRYISVRRFFIMVESSVTKGLEQFSDEPNDAGTWLKVKALIQSYLFGLWQMGALAGSKPEEAFFVHTGLNQTMTATDVLEGRMIVEIGMAAVRPAEFIILRFAQSMLAE